MSEQFECFFKFPSLTEDVRGHALVRWIPNSRLQHHIDYILKQKPQLNEATFVTLLLQNLQQNPDNQLAREHLTAFLARASYHAALKMRDAAINTPNGMSLDPDVWFQDLFQIALEAALKPTVFFKNFKFESSDSLCYPRLKKYIRIKMEGIICDRIRVMEGMKTFKYSDLGLASEATKKRVVDALRSSGINEPLLSQYVLAWQCFQEVKNAKNINVASPQPEQIDKIAVRYNQLCSKLPSSAHNQTVNSTTIAQWLQQIGKAIRDYIDGSRNSLDEPLSETSTLTEQLADEKTFLEWDILAIHEIQEAVAALKSFLTSQLQSLEAKGHRIPMLMHGLELSQDKIGIEMEVNQSTVGRQYKKLLGKFLQQLGVWTKDYLNIEIYSETVDTLKSYMEEHFKDYYPLLIKKNFQDFFQTFSLPTQELLWLYYVLNWSPTEIAKKLKNPEDEVGDKLINVKQTLQNGVAECIQQYIDMVLKPQGLARGKLVTLTEEWLKTIPYSSPF
jgi:hypothetical protein